MKMSASKPLGGLGVRNMFQGYKIEFEKSRANKGLNNILAQAAFHEAKLSQRNLGNLTIMIHTSLRICLHHGKCD